MKTFSYGATPVDVIRDALPPKYPMKLVPDDMLSLLDALKEGDDNAIALRTAILTTLDIEEI